MTWRTELQLSDGTFRVQSSPYANRRNAQRAAAAARSRRVPQTWRVVDNETAETWQAAPQERRRIMLWVNLQLEQKT